MIHTIKHIPIHPLQYPEKGQNYIFNGCMSFLMECLGENKQYDYWFFSAVSGDCFVQVFNTNKTKWSTCFSQAAFDERMIRRVFDAAGYDFVFLKPEEWRSSREAAEAKIRAFVEKGIPVIAKGFRSVIGTTELPTDEISCIIGYDDDGQCFLRMTEEGTDVVRFSLDDGLPYEFVFAGDKKEAPPLAKVYRDALLHAPELMRTLPRDNGDVHFGKAAFEQWAKALKSGFYQMDRAEFLKDGSIARWRYYCVYVCIVATNIFSKTETIDRALRLNPDLALLAPRMEEEYAELDRMEKELQAVGGFHIAYEVLQDAEKCGKLAKLIGEISAAWDRIAVVFSEIEPETM